MESAEDFAVELAIGDEDLEFDLDFYLAELFPGGVRLLDGPLNALEELLPRREGLFDAILNPGSSFDFDLFGSTTKQLLLPAITILLCREPYPIQCDRCTQLSRTKSYPEG